MKTQTEIVKSFFTFDKWLDTSRIYFHINNMRIYGQKQLSWGGLSILG